MQWKHVLRVSRFAPIAKQEPGNIPLLWDVADEDSCYSHIAWEKR